MMRRALFLCVVFALSVAAASNGGAGSIAITSFRIIVQPKGVQTGEIQPGGETEGRATKVQP